MPEQKNTFKLGLTVIVFALLFVAVLVFIARSMRTGGDQFVVRFPSSKLAARLKEGGDVVCGGQLVGTIRSIGFREETGSGGAPELYVYVSATVSPEVGLRQDCKIVPDEQLLGEVAKLKIEDRGVGSPVDPAAPIEGQTLHSLMPSIDMLAKELDPENPSGMLTMIKGQLDANNAASFMAKIHRSLDDLNAMTRNVSLQLNPGQRDALLGKLHATLDNLNAATGSLREQLEVGRDGTAVAKVHVALDAINGALRTVSGTLEDNRPTITEAIRYTRNTARSLSETIAPRVADQLDVDNPASLMTKAHTGVDSLNASLKDINDITGTGRNMIVSNQPAVNKIIANLLDTSETLKAGIRDLAANPWRLFHTPTAEELERRNVLDAARNFASAATALDNAALRLKGVIDAGGGKLPSDDPETTAIRDALRNSFEQYQKAEQALWSRLNVR